MERVHRGVTQASDTVTEARQDRVSAVGRKPARRTGPMLVPYLQAAPMALVFFFFFVLPLAATIAVSFWQYTQYSIEPAITLQNYGDIFQGCLRDLPDLCTTFRTYLSTLKFCLIVWATTLTIGFTIAYFLAFHVRTLKFQVICFLLCTVPFWTSVVIRMISGMPLLGRNGLVNQTLISMGVIDTPLEGLLYSDFAVILSLTHLYTLFMVVPIFNSLMRIDRTLIEAARDAGANGFQILTVVIIPLARPGILIGSIFVITVVMGDFLTIGIMGGQQIASVGKIIQTQMQFLQFPLAAANAVILLAAVLVGVWALLKLVDIRKEL
jgi:putative spermidine/putrescine transport system permease protein